MTLNHQLPTLNWFGRGGRVVYCGGLENRCARKRTGGSNPSLSASLGRGLENGASKGSLANNFK